jgi:hypothetical protein
MRINYDITIPETEKAFMMFWKKYGLRRSVLLSAVYVIAIVLFVDMIINNGSIAFGGIGFGLAAGMLISIWLRPFRSRKKLVEALETMYEEKYSAVFGETEIEVETIIQNSGESENGENETKIEKSTYAISAEELYSAETDEMFLLYVNRSLIHLFPKRCLSEQEIQDLRAYFAEKRI